MNPFQGGATLLRFGLLFILYTMFVWWRDVLHESTLEGHHTKVVIRTSIWFYFVRRIGGHVPFCSFSSFFSFFFSTNGRDRRYLVLDTREIPFLNTPILPSSGAVITWAHHAILVGKEKRAIYALVATVSLALISTGFQGMEYYQAPPTISNTIYGSTFSSATGFHGFHVIIGTLFSIICGIHQYLGHLTKEHHIGFVAAA
ncbi:hypothetical protein AMTRI_Chr01g110460 [Amborella trichopoda]